ncbi:hypothetical protein SKAU_G00316740 [Synaphobranchus kaupii]|uniref:Uncharacterized protein n=1 Tax=Synaphobranchus kaupii TaxID=118154 RepID=A0A9Q1ESR3_SYNKA|nr:hypothetical protein SKAU_G00316740 [Synaphobranchus kaupii]
MHSVGAPSQRDGSQWGLDARGQEDLCELLGATHEPQTRALRRVKACWDGGVGSLTRGFRSPRRDPLRSVGSGCPRSRIKIVSVRGNRGDGDGVSSGTGAAQVVRRYAFAKGPEATLWECLAGKKPQAAHCVRFACGGGLNEWIKTRDDAVRGGDEPGCVFRPVEQRPPGRVL